VSEHGQAAAAAPRPMQTYPLAAALPTQHGPRGIRFDYNNGCRVALPKSEVPWRVRLSDLDTGNIIYETTTPGGVVASRKRYFLRCRIEVWQNEESVFAHDYSAAGRRVLMAFPLGSTIGIGDTIGWFPYVAKFQAVHGCRMTCSMPEALIPLFQNSHPDIAFITPEQIRPERYYATYDIGIGFIDEDRAFNPCDFRLVGLHRAVGYALGVDPAEERPRLALPALPRPVAEPYVCIAVQATKQCKYWNNPAGWDEIVAFLKGAGYRVFCIDRRSVDGVAPVFTRMPQGAEDLTGERPLIERAHWLHHADFFIGLSSGLSWLAWAAGTPVVLISGFTHPLNEFTTPYRVINYHACNSCWNDPKLPFDHHDFLWCPRHKGTSRHFECSRLITAEQVKQVIRSIPGFAARRAA